MGPGGMQSHVLRELTNVSVIFEKWWPPVESPEDGKKASVSPFLKKCSDDLGTTGWSASLWSQKWQSSWKPFPSWKSLCTLYMWKAHTHTNIYIHNSRVCRYIYIYKVKKNCFKPVWGQGAGLRELEIKFNMRRKKKEKENSGGLTVFWFIH